MTYESDYRLYIFSMLAFLGLFATAQAATVSYNVTNISENSWEYTYMVANDTLGADLEEFTIFFDVAIYENLAVTASPVDWDSLVVQPDPGLPDNGFFDSLALVAGIAPAGSLSGFAVSFDYLGSGTPGAQPFDVVDPITLATLESGTTTLVPLPGALWLLFTGMIALATSGGITRRH